VPLEDIAEEMVTEVLPALHLLYLEVNHDDDSDIEVYDSDSVIDYDYVYNSYFDDFEPVGSTDRFRSLHQLSGRPVTIGNTEDEFVERLNARRMCQEKVPWQLALSSVI